MLARIWMDTLSTAGRLETPAPKTEGPAESLVVEHWDAGLRRFVARELIWDGKSYVEVK